MQTYIHETYGFPEVIQLSRCPRPTIEPDQVLVKVRAISLNSWDWDVLTGVPFEYRFLNGFLKPSKQQLHACDIAGDIVAIGANVDEFDVGDAVFTDMAGEGWGGFSEYVAIPAVDLSHKPNAMSYEQVACLSHGGNLAVQGLIELGNVSADQQVLINGGGGSTGTLAIQLAKNAKAEVTAVDNSAKLDFMRSLGADHVIDYTTTDFTESKQLYDLVFDTKTNRPIKHYERVLSSNGRYITVGGQSTKLIQIVLRRLLNKQSKFQVLGYQANKDNQYLLEACQSGALRPNIDRVFSFKQVTEAFRYFAEGCFLGKVVVSFDHNC